MTTVLRRPRSVLALGAIAVLTLSGCSSGTADAEPTADADDAGADESADGLTQLGDGEEFGGNGVSGLIAAVSDALMQVQETDSQTAVTWTEDTVITRTASVGLDTVAVGSCVAAMVPTVDEGSTETVVATSVTVSDPVDGECSAGFGGVGGLGGPPSGDLPEGTERPDGGEGQEGMEPPEGMELPEGGELPEDGELPEGMGGSDGMAAAFGQVVSGRVTAVSGSTLTVETTDADGVTATETVETDADTAVTATVAADASAIAVGLCALVRGETDTRGGMTATTIGLSDAGEDGCTARMGALRTPANGGDDD